MSNSKKFYSKMILTYTGIFIMVISIICMMIFSIVIKDEDLSGKSIAGFAGLGIIGLIMFIMAGNFNMLFSFYRNHGGKISLFYDYKNVGVPNNKYEEFKVFYNDICINHISLVEISKGIYKGTINNKEIVFDMTGWLNQTYYIYEYFLSILQVKLSNGNKKKITKELKLKFQMFSQIKSILTHCMSLMINGNI